MALVNLPFTLTNGTTADADEVQANFNALRDGVNNIEAEQIVNGTITDDKLANPQGQTVGELGFQNFVVDGTNWITVTTSPDLNYTIPAFVAYVNGIRVEKGSVGPRLYTASRDTYVDMDDAGVITYSEVLNGGTAPAQAAGTIRLLKVVTNATQVTDVQTLANTTALPGNAGVKYRYMEVNPTRNTGSPSTPGNQKIFVQFQGFDSTGVYAMSTGEAGVEIDLGNKQVPNGYDQLGNPSANTFLHIYVIAAADGSAPIAGLASQGSTFADAGPYPVNFPAGYDISKYVGSVFVEPEGYLIPSAQNGLHYKFMAGWYRGLFGNSDNSKWITKNLSSIIPAHHSHVVKLSSRVDGSSQTGWAHDGIGGNNSPANQVGSRYFTHGDNAGDCNTEDCVMNRNNTIVLFPQAISAGTGQDQQSTLAGGPRGFVITGWELFHD